MTWILCPIRSNTIFQDSSVENYNFNLRVKQGRSPEVDCNFLVPNTISKLNEFDLRDKQFLKNEV